jgi:histone-lysine N-methyltransferase SETMAR
MFTLIFRGHRLLAFDKLPEGYKTNGQYFCDDVLKEAKRSVTAITGQNGVGGMMIHMDNRKVHNSARTTQGLEEFQVMPLTHPPYSADISPCDFWFFGWSKDMMKGHQFQSADDVRAFLVDLWSNLHPSRLISAYEGWIARLEEVSATNGEYYWK